MNQNKHKCVVEKNAKAHNSKQDKINGLICTQTWQSHDNKWKNIKWKGNEIEKCGITKWAYETAVIMVFSRMSWIQMEARWSPTTEIKVVQRDWGPLIHSLKHSLTLKLGFCIHFKSHYCQGSLLENKQPCCITTLKVRGYGWYIFLFSLLPTNPMERPKPTKNWSY